MDTSGLPDMYTQSLRPQEPQALGLLKCAYQEKHKWTWYNCYVP